MCLDFSIPASKDAKYVSDSRTFRSARTGKRNRGGTGRLDAEGTGKTGTERVLEGAPALEARGSTWGPCGGGRAKFVTVGCFTMASLVRIRNGRHRDEIRNSFLL